MPSTPIDRCVADAEIHLAKEITEISLNATGSHFVVVANGEQLAESDAVILTVPVPHILSNMKGTVAELIGNPWV